MKRLITHSNDISVFSGIEAGETDEQALARARKFYEEEVANLESIISRQEHSRVEQWREWLTEAKAKLNTLQIEEEDAYFERARHFYLDRPAKEITKEHWWDMFEVLPPCGWTNTSRYEMFYVSESLHLTYNDFYLWDKEKDKYYNKVGDRTDRSTWIDVAMGYALPPPPKDVAFEHQRITEVEA